MISEKKLQKLTEALAMLEDFIPGHSFILVGMDEDDLGLVSNLDPAELKDTLKELYDRSQNEEVVQLERPELKQ